MPDSTTQAIGSSRAPSGALPTRFVPADHEGRVLERWEGSGAFHADPARVLEGGAKPYSIVIPPPNVTAALHLGHALNNTLQDVLVRAHRMMGFETLWMPGTDHAGIATQAVVEKRLLAEEGKRRTDYRREEFVGLVQAWKDEYEARITDQLERMGCSCDWNRQRFTMDDQCARAVREAFFRLFKEGLIYRGKRLVNWDPITQTALADDEVENREIDGAFYYLRYPLCTEDGALASATLESGETLEHVTVATTRPETYLGDTAVAVNPKDPRAAALRGRYVKLPFVGRVIPIIEDDYVVLPAPDPDAEGVDPKARYATGFLKVTPAHDQNDWEIGLRHGLEPINVMGPDASISDAHGWVDVGDAQRFVGMDRYDARAAVVKAFKQDGWLAEIKEPYRHGVGHSYRSHVPIEPWLSDQWYVKVTDDRLAGAAQRALAREQRSDSSFGGTALRAVSSGGKPLGETVLPTVSLPELDTTSDALPPLRPPGFVGRDPYPPDDKAPADLERRSRKLPHLTMPGATYFVTWRTAEGTELDGPARDEVLAAFENRHLESMQVYAVVVMPDHVHALVRPFDGQDLLTIVGNLKRFTATAINKRSGASGSLWQDEHFDHILRDEVEFSEALLYIARNPVEADLVERPTEYQWTAMQECVALELAQAVGLRGDGSESRPTKSHPTKNRPTRIPSSDGQLRFAPERYAKTYESWHDNIRDWCISRQLWWGHRIPVWCGIQAEPNDDQYANLDSNLKEWELQQRIAVHRRGPEGTVGTGVFAEIGSPHLFVCVRDPSDTEIIGWLERNGTFVQDPDVLDTWFSSALWPLSTLGWPDDTELLRAFNPTNVLCTAREIITLWVSRMVMFNRYFKNGDLPFERVYIHAMIQDGEGRKMSKSLGNGVDPLDIIHSHGADALRYTCCKLATNTQDVRMPVVLDEATGRNTSPKFDEGMKFANKLWNASRFTLMMLGEADPSAPDDEPRLIDTWMLSRLAASIAQVNECVDQYEFAAYAQSLYDLLWRDYCDWYLEAVKPTVKRSPTQQAVLRAALDAILRLLHPMCPFVTESVYEKLRELPARPVERLVLPPGELLCRTAWPEADDALRDESVERRFERLRELITIIRDVRAKQQVPPRARPVLHVGAALGKELAQAGGVVETLAQLERVTTDPAEGASTPFTFGAAELRLSNLGTGGSGAEKERLGKSIEELDKSIMVLEKRLSNPGYVDKAPANLVAQSREQLESLKQERATAQASLEALG